MPEASIEEARAHLGYKSKTDTVIFALKEIVRRGRIDERKKLIGRSSSSSTRRRSARKSGEAFVIFVDTSVWVAAWHRPKGKDAEVLLSLLDGDEVNLPLPVRVELRSGTSRKHRRALRHALGGLAVSRPTEDTWDIVERWIPAAAEAGYCFAVSDYLVAALACEHQGLVWSLDRDFEHMEKLGFVGRY